MARTGHLSCSLNHDIYRGLKVAETDFWVMGNNASNAKLGEYNPTAGQMRSKTVDSQHGPWCTKCQFIFSVGALAHGARN